MVAAISVSSVRYRKKEPNSQMYEAESHKALLNFHLFVNEDEFELAHKLTKALWRRKWQCFTIVYQRI